MNEVGCSNPSNQPAPKLSNNDYSIHQQVIFLWVN